MQRCPNCQSNQINGTIFCTECGGSLMQAAGREPSTVTFGMASPILRTAEAAPETLFEASPSETRLTLHVLATGRVLRLHFRDEILIGRKDAARGIVPDIDLSEDGGYDAGVSRRHAIISWHNGGYYIEDLGSANNTFVNDERVEPQRRVLIQNGDAIRCGMLDLRIEISP